MNWIYSQFKRGGTFYNRLFKKYLLRRWIYIFLFLSNFITIGPLFKNGIYHINKMGLKIFKYTHTFENLVGVGKKRPNKEIASIEIQIQIQIQIINGELQLSSTDEHTSNASELVPFRSMSQFFCPCAFDFWHLLDIFPISLSAIAWHGMKREYKRKKKRTILLPCMLRYTHDMHVWLGLDYGMC